MMCVTTFSGVGVLYVRRSGRHFRMRSITHIWDFFGGDEQSVAAASAGYCTSVGDVEIHGGAEEL